MKASPGVPAGRAKVSVGPAAYWVALLANSRRGSTDSHRGRDDERDLGDDIGNPFLRGYIRIQSNSLRVIGGGNGCAAENQTTSSQKLKPDHCPGSDRAGVGEVVARSSIK